jgi:hypothetical protein
MWRLIRETAQLICHPQQLVTKLLAFSHSLHVAVALVLVLWLTIPDVLRLGFRTCARWLVEHPIPAMAILLVMTLLVIIVFLLSLLRVTYLERDPSLMKSTSKRRRLVPRKARGSRMSTPKRKQRRIPHKSPELRSETWTGPAVSIIPSDAAWVHAQTTRVG